MSRFDYVRYDQVSVDRQGVIKTQCEDLEKSINTMMLDGRAKSLALTKLEEVYMWCGKGIRDDQIKRNGYASSQEERSDS